jgi:hypothetical protein
MIRYTLKCAEGHGFESWFQSSEAFEKLAAAGALSCAVCGGGGVEKAVMAPRVQSSRKKAPPAAAAGSATASTAPAPEVPAVAGLPAPLARKLAELKAHVERTADYVGKDFAREARAIHLGEAPERAIYGETGAEEARQLIEDGVPVAPLPFLPTRKTN